jgi:GABA(A) receptor-associated protein
MSFKNTVPFDLRKQESLKVLQKYPERIPCIVEKSKNSKLPSINKKKFLVPVDLTIGQFTYIIRKRFKLSYDKAIFLFLDNSTLVPSSGVMSKIYKDFKDEDGFLYFVIAEELTFGYGCKFLYSVNST